MAELDLDILEKIMLKERQKFTPEYFKEIALKSYNEDREYPENFSNWYPHIKDFGNFAHAEIISNQIFTFEEVETMQETDNIDKVNWDAINKILKPTLDKMENNRIYNIKNGCFSNKFDFETCLVHKGDLAKKLWQINYNSSMFSTGGYTELVVREFIPYNVNECLTMYNGMPLRTEVRLFYNMETKKVEYVVDYWDYDYCHKSLHSLNDTMIFELYHNKIKDFNHGINFHDMDYKNVLERKILPYIDTLKFDGKLKGIWSIDFMYDKDTNKVYLIDMARGHRSAYWNIDKLSEETRKELSNE